MKINKKRLKEMEDINLNLTPAQDNLRKEINKCKSGMACKFCDKNQQNRCYKKELKYNERAR